MTATLSEDLARVLALCEKYPPFMLFGENCEEATAIAASSFIRANGQALSALVKDAERYAWMKANCFPTEYDKRTHPHVIIRVCIGADERSVNWMYPGPESRVGIPSLDQAIDAAIAAASGENRT